MNKTYFEDQVFEKVNFSETPMDKGDYEQCRFEYCDFSNADLKNIHFYKCTFNECNLSMVNVAAVAMKDVQFTSCKMLGVHFENCSDFMFQVGFNNCVLNLSSFYKRQLKKAIFRGCTLHEVDFTDADATAAVFDNCDLTGAIFQDTVLEKADLRTAYNFSINPDINKIKKARFSVHGLVGLLDKYQLDIQL